ncbi:MAG: hypothetical protein KBC57_04045 [Neisseriaceae bacterium]|nr:hypothetical protein [Neisseriaceae bacterium]
MNKKMMLGLSLALSMATTGLVQAATNNATIPGVTIEREGGNAANQAQPRHWQEGHRMGPRGGQHQRGQHWQQGQQGPNGHHQGGMTGGLLTQAEAQTFRDQIMNSKDYNSCKRVQNQQHKTLLKRAKDKGVALPAEPRKAGMCERMADRGYFNRATK